MLEENKNLENPYLKKRTILKWIFIGFGIIFIIAGILEPVIVLFTGGEFGFILMFGVLLEYTSSFIGLGIVLILVGTILKKPTLWKKILLIIFIILSFPFIFRITIGNIVGHISKNETTITREGRIELSAAKLKEITEKAVNLQDENECKKLFPFYFLPPSLASRILSFWNPYKSDIYTEGFTECIAEVAKKKENTEICEKFGPFLEEGCRGCSLSYPFRKYDCLYLVSKELIKRYGDSKYCDLLKDVWKPPCAIQECLFEMAIKNKDFELCKRLKVEEGGWCPRRGDYYKECTDELSKISPELIAEYVWETHKNEEYAYKINYPDLWDLVGSAVSYCPGVSKQCHDRFFTIQGEENPKIYIYNPSPDAITIKKYNPFASDVPNIFEIEKDMKLVKTEKERIKDSEYYFEKFFYVPKEGIEKENVILVKWVAGSFERSGAILIYYKDETDEYLKIFNQILSTFRFLE